MHLFFYLEVNLVRYCNFAILPIFPFLEGINKKDETCWRKIMTFFLDFKNWFDIHMVFVTEIHPGYNIFRSSSGGPLYLQFSLPPSLPNSGRYLLWLSLPLSHLLWCPWDNLESDPGWYGWPQVTPGGPRMTPGWPWMTPGWPQGDQGWPRGNPGWPLGDPGWPRGDRGWPPGWLID